MGELEYIDNVDYGISNKPTIDELAEELAEACGLDASAGEVYEAIRCEVLKEIKLSELAITTIMPDLLELLEKNVRKARLVMLLLADPYASYADLGAKMGFSKQRVGVILHELSGRYKWLERLLELHNEN